MQNDKKQAVKGLKAMRGRGELQECDNCKCKRYGACGCEKKKETK